jgi:ketosteroid isomerase-like protein
MAVGVFAAACGGSNGSSDKDDVEQTLRDIVAAWNDQDYDAWSANFTENGIKAELADLEDQSPEGLRAGFENFSSEEELILHKIGEITVDGDTATAVGEASSKERGGAAPASIIIGLNPTLVKEDGEWKVDVQGFTSPEIPDGTATVDLEATEFSFTFDAAATNDGDFAFVMNNAGGQQHHIVIEKIPEDLDLEQALESEEDPEPEGLVHIGATPPQEPGDTRNIVFTDSLPDGRYAMLCFMPDTDGTPHAIKGMWKEFRVGEEPS